MAIEFDCPSCNSRIRTPDEAAGKKARCPNCKQIAPVPIASSPLADLGRPPPSSFSPASGSGFAPLPSTPQPAPPAGSTSSSSPPAWLPPASAFAPQGPPPSYGPPRPPGPPPGYGGSTPASGGTPAGPANPFSDSPAGGGYSTGEVNPYASPTGYGAYSAAPLTLEEIRGKLIGPAIGIALGAALGIGMIAFFVVAIIASPEFQRDAQNPNQGDFIAGCVVLFLMAAFGALPGFLGFIGAYAMYRGKGKAAAWVGSVASLVPCNPCFFIGAGFAIWGMVVLSDPRVSAGMK